VLALYAKNVVPNCATPKETAQRIRRLIIGFFGKTLAQIDDSSCNEYGETCSSDAVLRRHLEDLRAAINYHRNQRLCSEVVIVTLPPKRPGRERWLTRNEAAALIWHCWRYRDIQQGKPTDRRSRRHIAKFILAALYTGRRAGAVCAAALQPTIGHGYVDLDKGLLYPKPRLKQTKKRQPPQPLPNRLLAHLRRWKRMGQRFAVEYDRAPVKRVSKGFKSAVTALKLGDDVIPHTFRHTAATWQMQAGTPIWQAAGFLGMTEKQLTDGYAHHHPDFLGEARDAFARLHRPSSGGPSGGPRVSKVS
jgi:integrase